MWEKGPGEGQGSAGDAIHCGGATDYGTRIPCSQNIGCLRSAGSVALRPTWIPSVSPVNRSTPEAGPARLSLGSRRFRPNRLQRTPRPRLPVPQHVLVDVDGTDVLAAEEFLYGFDVRALFQEARRNRGRHGWQLANRVMLGSYPARFPVFWTAEEDRWRRSRSPVLGSSGRRCDGKTYCHPHSGAPFRSFQDRAYGTERTVARVQISPVRELFCRGRSSRASSSRSGRYRASDDRLRRS